MAPRHFEEGEMNRIGQVAHGVRSAEADFHRQRELEPRHGDDNLTLRFGVILESLDGFGGGDAGIFAHGRILPCVYRAPGSGKPLTVSFFSVIRKRKAKHPSCQGCLARRVL